jgi:hypothetical protein
MRIPTPELTQARSSQAARRTLSTGQPGQHAHGARGHDFYPTPAIAVTALLDANPDGLDPSLRIWEPATGDGGIATPLRERGFAVICSDIVRRNFPLHFTGDFFALTQAPAGSTTVLTNPPYQQAQRFAEHALDLVPDVWLLLRLAFLESVRRTELLEHRGLDAVYVFRRRLPRMHRDNWNGRRASSSICFAWFHWHRGHRGPPTLHRI